MTDDYKLPSGTLQELQFGRAALNKPAKPVNMMAELGQLETATQRNYFSLLNYHKKSKT